MSTLSSQQEEQIRELLRAENKIAAIKLYREATGVGLKEAKDAVEALERGQPFVTSVPTQSSFRHDTLLEQQIQQFLAERQKIQAVKLYREAHNCGLKEAKDAVDAIEAQMRREVPSRYPSAPAISDDPFAEDTQRRRIFLLTMIALFILLAGAAVFLLLTSTGF